MEFKIVSIQAMGSDLGQFLYVTLLPIPDPREAQSLQTPRQPAKYWIRTALPYTPEFGQLQIGDKFDFKKSLSAFEQLATAKAESYRTYTVGSVAAISPGIFQPQEKQNDNSDRGSNRGRIGVRRKAVRRKSNPRNRKGN